MRASPQPKDDTPSKPGARGRLDSLGAGEVACVRQVQAAQTSAKRLADMGFVRGTLVEMIRPGRPCLVRVAGTFVGLGIEHQRNVEVDRI